MPFEKEIVNTLRENFVWTQNTDTLLIKNGGLYHITFGLFSGRETPVCSLVVNGECLFSNSKKGKSVFQQSRSRCASKYGADKENALKRMNHSGES